MPVKKFSDFFSRNDNDGNYKKFVDQQPPNNGLSVRPLSEQDQPERKKSRAELSAPLLPKK